MFNREVPATLAKTRPASPGFFSPEGNHLTPPSDVIKENEMPPQSRQKRMKALKNYLGHEGEGMLRRGQAFDTTEAAAKAYINQGLAEPMDPSDRPSAEEAAEAMAEDARQKSAEPAETKESADGQAATPAKKGKGK